MIAPSSSYQIYLATKPVDFRKGMDGLANYVLSNFELDPFSGAFFVFRSKGRDKIKILLWDGTGLVMIYKRIEGPGFVWPKLSEGTITLTKAQFEALFEGIDWRRVASAPYHRPAVFTKFSAEAT
ncbi:IS66 family insertion sequence element accessory protein TnpB (plasmid) [Rhodobacteraceae bacterium SC52]|nr:IS66 family insertion sequence element accessory protein TnpB [Rhodobacteraceae bacterium SC52]